MELLPPQPSHGFKSLKLLQNLSLEDRLSELPFGADSGVLNNGIRYYVRSNPKPRHRAALALGVKVGSVLEEDDQRGVAHIVEHLAFSATKSYTNHDIVKFLESIGAEFGACQNASTSPDETIFELLVPIDKPELLSNAISILADFSTEIRISDEDLEKERGAVFEEYRGGRNALGRMQESHWMLMMKGSRYAERQPIGLEKIIRTVPANRVRDFYHRWYKPEHMTVVVVGDFEDTKSVVALIQTHFEDKYADLDGQIPTSIPIYPVPDHNEPRFSCFGEAEAGGSAVVISCKHPARGYKTVEDYRFSLVEGMFHTALNQRFFKISRQKNPPFFSCSSAGDNLVVPVKAYLLSGSCKEKGTLVALESILTEIARVRQHGFSDREIAIVRAFLMADIESAYLEKDQMQSTALRDEYLQHFLHGEPVVGIEYEAQLQKTLLPQITSAEVSKIAENYRTTCSCVIKTVEPRSWTTHEDLKAIVSKVQALEDSQAILPWEEEKIPEEIVEAKPTPGSIVSQTYIPELDSTELVLSNGMRICYKSTNFLEDQVLFTGFSYGGLSEVSRSDFLSCSMGSSIAGEIGVFGHKPSMLSDMLAGKRAEVGMKVGAYMRTFSGDCSPSDLDVALQLVYQLFITQVTPGDEEVKLVMQMTKEAILAQERDPLTSFSNRVRELNYGSSYYFKPVTIKDLKKIDPRKACQYFDDCFKDPSTFTVALVGNIDHQTALPLILQYLGGIPKPEQPVMCFQRDELTGLPFSFPSKVVREEVRRHMIEAQSSVQLTFPIELRGPNVMEEVHLTDFICKLLETRIMQILRFKHGQVYSAAVTAFLGGNKPSRAGNVRGDIAISFSCDPESSWRLIDIALDEVMALQGSGPKEEDVASILEIEQRAFENGQQENSYWLDRLIRAYQSRIYTGNVKESFQVQDEWRNTVRAMLKASSMQEALQKILPSPSRSQYTAVILMPRLPLFQQAIAFFASAEPHLTREKVVLVAATVMLITAITWRYLRKS